MMVRLALLEDKKVDSIAYMYNFLNKKEDKEIVYKMLQIISAFYMDVLLNKLQNRIDIFIDYKDLINKMSEKNNEKSLICKLININKYENMLEYNLNISLFLDRLIIEIGGISNA